MTYGAAAGVDLTVGLACLAAVRRRGRRCDPVLGLALVALTVAGTTGLLCTVHSHEGPGQPVTAIDQVHALTTVGAFLPLAWCVGVAWSLREDDAEPPVAVFYLCVAVLFALNRYDALVADGTIGTVFLQPLTLPVLLIGLGTWRRLRAPAGTSNRRIAERATTAALDERHRIARELHDSVSQTLYSVAMAADTFPTLADSDPAAARRQAGQIRSMTLDALDDLRVLLVDMRRSTPETGGLRALLEQLAGPPDSTVRVEVDVEAEVGAEPEPPPEVRFAAYRIAHQAVTNARRHAAASTIVVRLRQGSGTTTVAVTDDGAGFDPDRVPPGRHGLQIMRERAASVGADLRIATAPGHGTVVAFSWPATALPPARVVEP